MIKSSKSGRHGARAIAALVIQKVLDKQLTLSAVLPEHLGRLAEKKDKALTQELTYGVMRWYFRLDFLLGQLLDKTIKDRDNDIRALLLIGLYQFLYLRIPPHAVVSATVEAARELNKVWAKNLINAILRRFQRESEDLLKKLDTNEIACYAHPEWLLEILKKEYPAYWQEIVAANNSYPPMTLRVNTRKMTRQEYLRLLKVAGINVLPVADTVPGGIILEHAVDVDALPRFRDGLVSVQDLAAQLTPQLMDLHAGQLVLDACAAPGGKLAHILEYEPEIKEATGLEQDPSRYERLQQTMERLQLKARLVLADARATGTWWNGVKFDRILLDAPCSATGVIRRHPDIKVLRTVEDVETAMKIQSELLTALWPLLKPGGKLLYATCSILKAENDQQVGNFLSHHPDASSVTITSDWGVITKYGRQILPGQNNMDGFYYACLQKIQ